MMKEFYKIIPFIFCLALGQEVAPEVTMERKKLIILASEIKDSDISKKIIQIASSTATQLNRYNVIDRSQLARILNEQKLQHSGVVNPDQAIEIGKVAGANEALFISITNFGQKGVPTEKQEEKDEEEEPETGLFGWIVKEVVKAGIDKELENVERYPNNIQTVISGEVRLLNVETGKSISSFNFSAEHTGGVKAKSLNKALKKVRSQMVDNLKSLYQLSSEVLHVQGNDIMLLLGKNMGVHKGMVYEIRTLDTKRKVRDRDITIPGKTVGFVEVVTVSADASEGRVLRKWDSIEPGYQAKEQTEGLASWSLGGLFGSSPENYRLRIAGNYKPFHQFGGAIYLDLGMVKDSREDPDFLFGFGLDMNYRLIRTSPFSLGGVLSLPFDFNSRNDDEDNAVILPIFSPRIGLQSEIMLSPKLDLVLRAEYCLASINLGGWTYSEDNGNDDDSSNIAANWDDGIAPEIDYSSGMAFTVGIRMLVFE